MGLETVKQAFECAKNQREKAIREMYAFQVNFTNQEFKDLFLLRAELAMIEHRTPGQFTVDDDNRDALSMLYYYASRTHTELINPNIGIIMAGKYGCGKSIVMSGFCKVLYDLGIVDQKIEEVHAIALSEMIKADGILPWALKPLLIQDMGTEEPVINAYGTKINPIGNLLAVRAEYGSLTFGSTNKKWSSLNDHYSEYVGTRAKEHVNFIHMKGGSRRKDFRNPEIL
jgi:DNA replication protein DnaC